MDLSITCKIAESDQDFEHGRELFLEYAGSLPIDLAFQNFSKELETIRDQYHKPQGALLLTYVSEELAGCAGIRKLNNETAELKRMYVRPEYRGYKLGKELLTCALKTARELGYRSIRLDTLSTMTKAQKLYESFGFQTIAAYYPNPFEDTIYMEKML
jgi:ribosomal protein S18 acetylase RimI-like enzyme